MKLSAHIAFIFLATMSFGQQNGAALNHELKSDHAVFILLDVSYSMIAKDFSDNRLEAAKKFALQFAETHNSMPIGLILFGGEAFMTAEALNEHDKYKEQVHLADTGAISNGSAIGTAVTLAIKKFEACDSQTTKTIVLLSDGSENSGPISTKLASDIANLRNIRIFSIGMSDEGEVMSPYKSAAGIEFAKMPSNFDETLLRELSLSTGGIYIRAKNDSDLVLALSTVAKTLDSK